MRELRRSGQRVRMINRTGHVPFTKDLETEVGGSNAQDPRQTREVCEGATAVFHCAGLPYRQWETLPAIASGIIEGAAHAGASLVYGDNLYMYGPVAGPMNEDLPSAATTRKGRIRTEVATMLLDAHRNGKVQVAIGRGSDFFGPHATDNVVMGTRVFGAALADKSAKMIGNPDKLHTYSYLGDFGKALVLMSTREDAHGKIWHVPSAPAVTSRKFIQTVYRLAGREPRVSIAPRFLLPFLGRFNPQIGELIEMLYQFEGDFVMDSSRFATTFSMQPTPLDTAITETLDWFRQNPGN